MIIFILLFFVIQIFFRQEFHNVQTVRTFKVFKQLLAHLKSFLFSIKPFLIYFKILHLLILPKLSKIGFYFIINMFKKMGQKTSKVR